MAEANEGALEGERRGSQPWLAITFAALISLLAGAGGTVLLFGSSSAALRWADAVGSEAREAGSRASFPERVFALDPFVVNVNGEGYPRYLKMEVAFEMDSPESRRELEARAAQVRDATIFLLSTKRIADLIEFEGKALLKDDLRDRVDAVITKGRVESVLFTEFVVQ